MNILIDKLPIKVEINKKMYEINSDFRTSILFEQLMQDNEIEDYEKGLMALNLYFNDYVDPDDLDKALDKIYWFYSCGKDKSINYSGKKSTKEEEQIYNWDYDDEYIYAAFLDQYNIDLQDIEFLHWWKFKAMFKSLKENHKISEIMKYRAINLNEIEDKEVRKHYKKMKEIYALPKKIDKTELERKNKIEEILMGDGVLKNL